MSAKDLLAIDLEITNIIPPEYPRDKWFELDLWIACVSVAWRDYCLIHSEDRNFTETLIYVDNDGVSRKDTGVNVWPSVQTATRKVVESLDRGKSVTFTSREKVSWNGASFDFRLLHKVSQSETAKELCLNHVDLMLNFWWVKGHRLGLDKALRGYGLANKLMPPQHAPIKWAQGKYQEVIKYCEDDARKTLMVAEKVLESGGLRWMSRQAYPEYTRVPWMTVREIMEKVAGNRYDIEEALEWLN